MAGGDHAQQRLHLSTPRERLAEIDAIGARTDEVLARIRAINGANADKIEVLQGLVRRPMGPTGA